ncbi:MAG: S1C family serine protease [Bacteroidota bacterium]|jgi:S1-C subfamily serine protease
MNKQIFLLQVFFIGILISFSDKAIALTDTVSVWKKVCDDFSDCKLVFTEKFKDNANQWPLINDEEKGIAEIMPEGGLHIKTNKKIDFGQWVKLDVNQTEDFSIESAIDFKGGSNDAFYGVIYGLKDWENYHFFCINASGYYNFGVRYEGLNAVFSGNLYSSNILKGKQSNKLKIKKVGKKVFFSVNGEIIDNTNYKAIVGKRAGFVVFDGKVNLQIQNLIYQRSIDADAVAVEKGDEKYTSSGSGFIVSSKGYVVTNYHVIEKIERCYVELKINDEIKTYEADIVQKDPKSDLAILKIKGATLDAAKFKIPYAFANGVAEVGTQVFTLGYPMALTAMGKEVKFTDGKISSKTGYQGDISAYQTSVPVQPGNSGGPLFDNEGRLVGIVNAKIMEADNVSYAVKSGNLRNMFDLLPEQIESENKSEIANLPLEQKIKVLSKFTVLIKSK